MIFGTQSKSDTYLIRSTQPSRNLLINISHKPVAEETKTEAAPVK